MGALAPLGYFIPGLVIDLCVLLFSKFIILRYIGALIAVVMFTSSALSMTVIPGLLNAFDPKFMWSESERNAYKEKIAAEKKNKSAAI